MATITQSEIASQMLQIAKQHIQVETTNEGKEALRKWYGRALELVTQYETELKDTYTKKV